MYSMQKPYIYTLKPAGQSTKQSQHRLRHLRGAIVSNEKLQQHRSTNVRTAATSVVEAASPSMWTDLRQRGS